MISSRSDPSSMPDPTDDAIGLSAQQAALLPLIREFYDRGTALKAAGLE
jgi:hypothetical protein